MSINEKVRQRFQAALKQQSSGLLGLANLFKEYDTDSSGSLSWEEFCAAIQKCGLAPSPQDIRSIFLDLDRDGNNEISYPEFILAMRGELSNQRKVLIKRVFENIDSDGDGVISMTDIGKCFNPKNHPDVKVGRITVAQLLREFLDSFSTVSEDGYVTLPQFIEYYANSAAFDDDIKFAETMKGLWNMSTTSTIATPSALKTYTNNGSAGVSGLISGNDAGLSAALEQLREQLRSRGARGFVGLQRKFKIMDDDGNKSLNLVEFKKGIKESGLNFSELQLSQMFQHFDRDRNGSVDIEEFLVAVRGPMNARRKRLIAMAFNVLDKNGSGEVDPEDIVNVYDASKHPDVIAGKRTADDVLREFLDTFDVGGVKDGKVTREEFENYYANVGANIDDDDYFELMIRNAWHISGGTGWSANSANRRVLVTRADGSEAVEEIKNDLGLKANDKAGMMARLKAQGVDASNISTFGSAGDDKNNAGFRGGAKTLQDARGSRPGASSLGAIANRNGSYGAGDSSEAVIAAAGPSAGGAKPVTVNVNVAPGLQHIIVKLKTEMKSRGANGFIGLQRKFKIMDDDNSKTLSLAEFKKAMKEMNLNLSDAELRMLFDHFDQDRSSTIDFEEFIQGVRDPLTERRLRLVQLAFAKIDKDGSGEVDAEEIASMYDASKHPEVIAGRMTPQQVLNQFLDTFDVGGVKDGMVTQQEFINYYTNLGANIDNEDYFELMIRNAWHISGGSGWSANSANRRVLVTHSDGSQSVQEIKDDLGLKADDKAGMSARLKAQGVDVAGLSLHDSAGDEGNKATKPKPANLSRLLSGGGANASGSTGRHTSAGGRPSVNPIVPPQPPTEALIARKGPSSTNPIVANSATYARPATAPAAAASAAVNSARIDPGLALIVKRLKEEMKARGANGFIGLQRKFRIMDDDNSKSLNLGEFKKAMKEMNLNLSDGELRMLFDHFDSDGSGSIDFEEFIQGVRDPLTPRRHALVLMAFGKIDKDGNGMVEAAEIASMYDASKHPDVMAGKRTPEDILREFLDTFDVGGVKDGMVTQEEFVNYYTNLGANIDNEDYFELMIRNAWHISGGSGWSANSANRRVLVTHSDGSQSVQEIKDDLGLKSDDKAGMTARLRAQGVDVAGMSTTNAAGDEGKSFTGAKKRIQSNQFQGTLPAGILPGTGVVSASTPKPKAARSQAATVSTAPVGIRALIDRFKAQMKLRGANGFIGLQRKFRIMDDDNNKTLNLAEFKKAMKEMKMDLSDTELRVLFEFFDTDNSGGIDFEEFIQGVRDPLTDRRLALVKLAFAKIDTDGSGEVDAAEIASKYDASKHPEVIAGRMTAQQVLNQFLDTFDVGGVKDGMVTQQEFINYYTNLGANIDNEDYFELMIRNAWHISGGSGWSANSANRRVLVTHSDGSQSVQEIKDDLGLKADDKAGMIARLKKQGVDVAGLSLHDSAGDEGNNTAVINKRLPAGVSAAALNPSLGNGGSRPSTASSANNNNSARHSKKTAPSSNYGVTQLIVRLKGEMKKRGANGFIGLQRKFKIMDDDGSKTLNMSEFKKAMKEMKLELTDAELRALFEHFDVDGNGSIDFEEFIQGIRDPLTDRREALVKLAFAKIDTDNSGIVEAAEIASKYDASKHPEVIAGRMTPEQVLAQFLDTFDVGGVKDGMVTQQEFINYYTNLGANIDNEDYFELMIRNAWHISGGSGWSANSANRRVLVTHSDGSQSVQEIKDDLGLKADDIPGMTARLRAQNMNNVSSISLFGGENVDSGKQVRPQTAPSFMSGGGRRHHATSNNNDSMNNIISNSNNNNHGNHNEERKIGSNTFRSSFSLAFDEPTAAKASSSASNQGAKKVANLANIMSAQPASASAATTNNNRAGSSLASIMSNNNSNSNAHNNNNNGNNNGIQDSRVADLMNRLRENLKTRGASGIIGIQRKFRIIDDDNSKSLNVTEFTKALRETGLNFSPEEILLLFKYFDADRNGTIDFEEFLQKLRGPMNPRRKQLISLAFNVLDKDGSGEVTPEDLISSYDTSKHPDVIAGKKTKDQVLREFLDTFDVGGVKDGLVTREEFENYYANVSSSIDNDDYFELMIRNAWHISGGSGWSANSANRRVLVTHSDGSQSVQEIQNDLGLKSDDKAGMIARLKKQNVDTQNIDLYGASEDTTNNNQNNNNNNGGNKARGFGARPGTGHSTGGRIFGGQGETIEPQRRKNLAQGSQISFG